jgi:hypothetical protein
MLRPIALFLLLTMAACHHAHGPSPQSPAPNPAADTVRLITSDIPNFWRAYELAAGKDTAERARIFQETYLRPGTPGLRDWMRLRLMNRATVRSRLIEAGWTAARITELSRQPRGTAGRDSLEDATEPIAERSAAEELVAAIGRFPRYYADVQPRTLLLDQDETIKNSIRRGLRRLAELYPDAKFPHVYFVVGTLSTGGTVGRSGMLIGTEQYSAGPETPREELPDWAKVATVSNNFASISGLVIHEAVHTLQASRERPTTLLSQALGEGIADFLSELAVGPWHANTPRQIYGRAHEHDVWVDFQDEMATDSTLRTWMYNGMVPPDKNHGAVDIGYWVGYAIAKSYYERASDKTAAVRALLRLENPEQLLAESGYNP